MLTEYDYVDHFKCLYEIAINRLLYLIKEFIFCCILKNLFLFVFSRILIISCIRLIITMMESSTKAIEILKLYKQLHRTVQTVFKGDVRAQIAARDKIRSEFYEKKNITDSKSIKEMIKYGNDCDTVLRTQIIQAVAVAGKESVYRATVTEHSLVDNAPYRSDISDAEYKASVRAARNKKSAKSLCEENKTNV